MILCRRCTTRHEDDATVCSECEADLTGPDGLRLGPTMRSDWDPAEVRPPEPRPDPIEPSPDPAPAPPPAAEPAARTTNPLIDSPRSDVPPHRASPADRGTGRPTIDPPVSPPPPGESGAIVRPDREAQGPADPGGRQPRRGRRPGEVNDDEVEPDAHQLPTKEAAAPAEDPSPARPPATSGSGRHDEAQPDADRPPPNGPAIRDIPGRPTTAEADQAMPKVPAAATATLADGEIACPSCRRANGVHRRFCRFCATTLPAFVDEPDEDDAPQHDSFIRRILGTTRKPGRDSRTFQQRARDAGQRKIKYRAKYTVQSKLRSLGYIGGGLAGLVLVLGPVRHQVMERLNPPEAVSVESVMYDGDVPFPDDGGPEFAHDDAPDTAFVLLWSDSGPAQFSFRMPGTDQPKKIEFETGYPDDDLDRGSLYLRPFEVTLSANGAVQQIELGNHEGEQRFGFDLPDDVSVVTISILSVHETAWETYDRVAINEIRIVD